MTEEETKSVVDRLQQEIARLERERQYHYDRWFMNERALQAEIERGRATRTALQACVDHHVALVNCGDCGFWNPEEEEHIIKARAVLSARSLEVG